ncbi:MAG: DUF2092 domain-containing protein [Methylococcales bacterium]|nr:DUF2092 domain-containing protein [Methylococcales bacterium]MDP3838853.1 DUF2092 domain-containing protein [Methylococcales bacterium]
MKSIKKISLLLAVTALTLQGCATAPEKKSVSTPPKAVAKPVALANQPKPAVPTKSVIQQYALDRLKQMSDKLVASNSFSYRSNSAIELESDTGQFVTFFTEAEVALQRPNKLHVEVFGDTPNLHLYFDGNKASAFDADNKLYAVSTPLSTIDETLNFIMTKAEINFPSADIMYSDPYAIMTKNLTDATVVGDSMIDGVEVEHFAYRDPAIDWEIWIAKGEKAVPMRLAMKYKQVERQPSFLVEFADWKLNPKLKAKMFEFKVPADAKQIEFGTYHEQPKK